MTFCAPVVWFRGSCIPNYSAFWGMGLELANGMLQVRSSNGNIDECTQILGHIWPYLVYFYFLWFFAAYRGAHFFLSFCPVRGIFFWMWGFSPPHPNQGDCIPLAPPQDILAMCKLGLDSGFWAGKCYDLEDGLFDFLSVMVFILAWEGYLCDPSPSTALQDQRLGTPA